MPSISMYKLAITQEVTVKLDSTEIYFWIYKKLMSFKATINEYHDSKSDKFLIINPNIECCM